MRALFKTLFGDAFTIAAAAAVVFVGGAAARAGHPDWAAVLMPAVALGGIAWLVRH